MCFVIPTHTHNPWRRQDKSQPQDQCRYSKCPFRLFRHLPAHEPECQDQTGTPCKKIVFPPWENCPMRCDPDNNSQPKPQTNIIGCIFDNLLMILPDLLPALFQICQGFFHGIACPCKVQQKPWKDYDPHNINQHHQHLMVCQHTVHPTQGQIQ